MSVHVKRMLCVLLIVLSITSNGIGSGLVGATDFSHTMKFLLNFVFHAQFIVSLCIAVTMLRETRGK